MTEQTAGQRTPITPANTIMATCQCWKGAVTSAANSKASAFEWNIKRQKQNLACKISQNLAADQMFRSFEFWASLVKDSKRQRLAYLRYQDILKIYSELQKKITINSHTLAISGKDLKRRLPCHRTTQRSLSEPRTQSDPVSWGCLSCSSVLCKTLPRSLSRYRCFLRSLATAGWCIFSVTMVIFPCMILW